MEKFDDKLIRSTQLIGAKLVDIENNKLGKIDEIIFDKFSGKIQYIIFSFSSVLNRNAKWFAVPWGGVFYNKKNSKFIINRSKHDFEEDIGLEKEVWATFDSKDWENLCKPYQLAE